MTEVRQATVVGGGIVGCCTAYYLARLGCQVTLLERNELGHGASQGNCGYLCPSHVLPLATPTAVAETLPQLLRRDGAVSLRLKALPGMLPWLVKFLGRCNAAAMQEAALARHQLLQSSQQLYGELFAAHDFACEWQTTGLMLVYRNRQPFDAFASIASRLERDFDIRVARVPADQLTEQEPTLRDGLAGGWCFPGDSHLRPDKLMAGFRALLPQLGVQVREGVEVLGLEIQHGQLQALKTSVGTLPVDRMVLTAGAETAQFAKPLHCKLPIQAGKGYSLTFRTQQRLPRMPMIFEAHHVAVTPFAGALRIGSTMEFAGLDRSINRQRVQLLMKSARAHLREVPEETHVQPWAGWRPMTYDGIPRIGPTPCVRNVVVAAGNGMVGLASGPATGKLAAELCLGVPPHVDPRGYAVDRGTSS